ncbi:hypothetical protein ACF1BP_21330 [Streptomyces sp. NPDC014735]|uniref:hypothetical protein n=1 Tax=unclassified Streptomyces TaxID=2593676 RepID=UPI0036FCDC38
MTRGGAPVVVGDRALLVDGYGVGAYALDTTGEEDMTGSKMYTDWPSNPGDPLDPASVSLVASGDVLFLGFGDGTVLSGYAP